MLCNTYHLSPDETRKQVSRALSVDAIPQYFTYLYAICLINEPPYSEFLVKVDRQINGAS